MDRWGEVSQGLEHNRKMPHLMLGLTVSWGVTRRELSGISERLLKQLLQGPRYEVAVTVGVLTWASLLDTWSVDGAREFSSWVRQRGVQGGPKVSGTNTWKCQHSMLGFFIHSRSTLSPTCLQMVT